MNSIDNELATLHARIAQLEEMKKIPSPKPTVEELLNKMKESDKDNHWRKNESPVATACRFMNKDNINMLESIVESLKSINSRIDALEKKEDVILDEDVQMFNALKKKRMELANAAGVPAFHIASNRSLRSLVSVKPKTLEEVRTVFGFGPYKTTLYGQQFLDVINPRRNSVTIRV